MDKIDSLLKEIKVDMNSLPIVKEYFRLREAIQNDERLSSLDKEIKVHQKKMCSNKDNEEVLSKEREVYEKLTIEYESDPLIKNYKQVKDEVYALLYEVKGVLD